MSFEKLHIFANHQIFKEEEEEEYEKEAEEKEENKGEENKEEGKEEDNIFFLQQNHETFSSRRKKYQICH